MENNTKNMQKGITAILFVAIINLLRNNLEKPGERISVKRSNMRGAMDALEGSIS